MIQAKVIADSTNEFGDRITTLEVVMPRYILAEFNTHRMFSRNSASSRAIPFKKMLETVRNNPFIPMAWQEDHSGMQGTKYLPEIPSMTSVQEWKIAMAHATVLAEQLNDRDVTKQLCNRLIEPFMWHTVLVTSTEWENFFKLRCPQYWYIGIKRSRKEMLAAIKEHYTLLDLPEDTEKPDYNDILWWLGINKGQADIHMMFTAEAIYDAINESTPKQLKAGEWHIPYGKDLYSNSLVSSIAKSETMKKGHNSHIEGYDTVVRQIATARCARVSYTVPDAEVKEHSYSKDIELHDRLLKSGHWSPFEHCAKAMSADDMDNYIVIEGNKQYIGWCRNFRGFIQYRAMLDQHP
jgi:thymidylate synthase ThyX